MMFCKGLLPICLILMSHTGCWGKPKHHSRYLQNTRQGDDENTVVKNEHVQETDAAETKADQTADAAAPNEVVDPAEDEVVNPADPDGDQTTDIKPLKAVESDGSSLEKKANLVSKSCFCPLTLQPVCGTDGVTYPNRHCVSCMASSPEVQLAHLGACNKDDKLKARYVISKSPYVDENLPFPCYCPMMENLVCDADGDTHYNVHCMKCVKPRMTISKDGPCDEEDSRYKTYSRLR